MFAPIIHAVFNEFKINDVIYRERKSGLEITLIVMWKLINYTKSKILIDIITGFLNRKEYELRGQGKNDYQLIEKYLHAISATSITTGYSGGNQD